MVSPVVLASAEGARLSVGRVVPVGTRIRLLLSWGVVAAFLTGGGGWLAAPVSPGAAIACFLVLFFAILYAAFGVVREADHLADALGEPYGTLILTLSVVAIEVILIVAVMLGPGDAPTIARDAIYAVMMIILNLVTGLCLLLGGWRHGEQAYNAQGAVAYLSMIALLTTVALILPGLTAAGTGRFTPVQAAAMAGLTAVLYGLFLTLQMRGYRRLFIQPPAGDMVVPVPGRVVVPAESPAAQPAPARVAIDGRAVLLRSVVLALLMLAIILMAHDLAVLIDLGVERAGAPVAVGGVLIAIIVFTPESLTAIRAALANQMQRVVNLCLGAFVSTVGLTVPAVLLVGLATGQPVVLGLGPLDSVLVALTMGLTALSFVGWRTSPIQGLMHLMLFAVYAVLLFSP